MKVVIIGAGGFLGSSIYKGLYQNSEISEWHLFYSSNKINKEPTANCFEHIYTWPEQSLGDDLFDVIFRDAAIIIHAAGAGVQPGKEVEEELMLNLNLFEPVRLVEKLKKLHFKGQLISFGSYFETGENQPPELLNEQRFLEQYNRLPNSYCRSKKELSHFHFVSQHTGLTFKWLHLILTNIYGPAENDGRLIPYIIKQAKQGLPLRFTAGTQIRQYTYVEDVVAIISSLLGKGSGFYHVTNSETIPVKSIIEETLEQVKIKLSIVPDVKYDLLERRDISMDYLAVSPQKLLDDWNLRCLTSYQTGIASYFNI